MPATVTVGALCTRATVSTTPDAPVGEALQVMAESRLSSLLVTLCGEAIGIVTERDTVRSFAKISGYRDLTVRDIMSSPLLAIDAGCDARTAFLQMRAERIRHFAVVDPSCALYGLLSLTDLIHKLAPACIPAELQVAQVMTRQIVTIDTARTIRQALGEMAHRNLSCLLCCTDGEPRGMFSERDVPQLFFAAPATLDRPVGEVMTPLHPTISPETSALDAIATMNGRGIRRLVVARDTGVVGLVTQSLLGRAMTC